MQIYRGQGILISMSNDVAQHMDSFHYNLLVLKLDRIVFDPEHSSGLHLLLVEKNKIFIIY